MTISATPSANITVEQVDDFHRARAEARQLRKNAAFRVQQQAQKIGMFGPEPLMYYELDPAWFNRYDENRKTFQDAGLSCYLSCYLTNEDGPPESRKRISYWWKGIILPNPDLILKLIKLADDGIITINSPKGALIYPPQVEFPWGKI